jgi:cytochrome c-type biogenesis protein CcmH/NrfF
MLQERAMPFWSKRSLQAARGSLRVLLMESALLTVLLSTLLGTRALAETGSALRRADRASELEQRLLAPCCWAQTLDVHESDLSTALRIEIRARLSSGEHPLAIEDGLAARFGERIRAVPRGNDVRAVVPVAIGTGMVLSLFALLLFVRRGRRLSLEELRRDLLRAELPADGWEDDVYERELERALGRPAGKPRPGADA